MTGLNTTQPSEKEMDEQIRLKHPPVYFPITVKYDGDAEETIVDKPEDLRTGIAFNVTDTAFGKPQVREREEIVLELGGNDDEKGKTGTEKI